MTTPIDEVLQRLHAFKVRPTGRDRWRACCPSHGGSNSSALSIGVGQDEAVLLRCWHGCDVYEIAAALGLDLQDLFPRKPTSGQGAAPMRRRRMLTDGQALELLEAEIFLTVLCASDLGRGEVLDETTRDRLRLGAARISMMRDEAQA